MAIITAALGAAGVYLLAVKPSARRKWLKPYLSVLYAHRGLYDHSAGIPENSLAAFKRAKEHGYGMEFDVQLSKDGVPVIIHDTYLDRVVRDEHGGIVSGKTTDYTLAQLKSFHLLDTEEKIPTLAEVLNLADGAVPLIVELKTEGAEHEVPVCAKADEVLQKYHGLYIVESFNVFAVAWYRRHRPDIIRGQLSEAFTTDPKYRNAGGLGCEYLLFNAYAKPDFIAYNAKHWKNLSRNVARSLYRCPAVAWTIQSKEELEAMRGRFDLFIFEGFLPETGKKEETNPANQA